MPIIGLSPNPTSVRQMQLYWGVKPFEAPRADSTDILIESSLGILKQKQLVKENDIVIVIAGAATQTPNSKPNKHTNLMRVITVG